MINIYYYNPKVIEHLYTQINKLPISKEEINKSNNTKLSIASSVAKFFHGEVENTFNFSKTQHVEYSNEYKVLKTIESLKPNCINISNYEMGHEGNQNIWLYTGKCGLMQQVSLSEKTINVQIKFCCNNVKYIGNTSAENWISSSTLNQALCSSGVDFEIGFIVISDKKNVKTIQVLYIYKMVV